MTAAARPHRHRTLLAYAATTVALVTLGACSGGDPAPTVTTPPTGASSTSSTSTAAPTTTTSTPSTTTAGPSFPAGLPNAAKARTPQGAEAFVQFYMARWNESWTKPDSSLLQPLCAEAKVDACATAIADAREYEAKGWRYNGTPGTLANVKALRQTGETQRVAATIQQHARNVVDSSGKVHETYPERPFPSVFYLQWTNTGWEVSDLRLIS